MADHMKDISRDVKEALNITGDIGRDVKDALDIAAISAARPRTPWISTRHRREARPAGEATRRMTRKKANEMSFFEHLGELRKRIVWSLVFVLVFFIASWSVVAGSITGCRCRC